MVPYLLLQYFLTSSPKANGTRSSKSMTNASGGGKMLYRQSLFLDLDDTEAAGQYECRFRCSGDRYELL
jgi:hypothetical protein